ncbi:hypothetical protein [Methylobacterium sp. JK268]
MTASAFEIAADAVRSALVGRVHHLEPSARIAVVEDIAARIEATNLDSPWMRDGLGHAILDAEGEFASPRAVVRQMVDREPQRFGIKTSATPPAAMSAATVTNLMVKARQGDSAARAQLDTYLKAGSR